MSRQTRKRKHRRLRKREESRLAAERYARARAAQRPLTDIARRNVLARFRDLSHRGTPIGVYLVGRLRTADSPEKLAAAATEALVAQARKRRAN